MDGVGMTRGRRIGVMHTQRGVAVESALHTDGRNDVKYAVFNVGDIKCGIDTTLVREINRNLEITGVRLAPEHVCGVINLRGEIVNVIDVRRILGLEPRKTDKDGRIIVVRTGEGDTGLLVDSVDDIAEADTAGLEPPPPHIDDSVGRYLSGVHRTEKELIAVLNVERIIGRKDGS